VPDDDLALSPPVPPGSSHPRIDTSPIPGWFTWTDQRVFEHVLGRQDDERPGTLVELGAYLGKSAVVAGEYLRAGEEFVVCDLFGEAAPDEGNSRENQQSYRTLTRQQFEANYLGVHRRLPTVLQAPTSRILEHVPPGSARFVHIDASHLYEHVRGDLEAAGTMLRPGGLVVCDDYRSQHTPGVAAAVWAAVQSGAIQPFCVTPSKLYACTGADAAPHREALLAWLEEGAEGLRHEVQRVAGTDLVRIWPRPAPKGPRPEPAAATPSDEVLTRLAALDRRLEGMERRSRRTSRLARAVAPRRRRSARRLLRGLLPGPVRTALRRVLGRG